jgi:hypothetical protein
MIISGTGAGDGLAKDTRREAQEKRNKGEGETRKGEEGEGWLWQPVRQFKAKQGNQAVGRDGPLPSTIL